jgi:hypothetical protein
MKKIYEVPVMFTVPATSPEEALKEAKENLNYVTTFASSHPEGREYNVWISRFADIKDIKEDKQATKQFQELKLEDIL